MTVFSQTSFAEVVRTSIVTDADVPTDGYRTAEVAVFAAVNRYNPDSVEKNLEHVGGIVRCGANSYFYTHGNGKPGGSVHFSILFPKRCKLDSLWHTHGGNFEDRRFFSRTDTRTANTVSKPMYMADYRGDLHIFQPGDRRFGLGKRTHGSIATLLKGSAKGTLIRNNDGVPVKITTNLDQ